MFHDMINRPRIKQLLDLTSAALIRFSSFRGSNNTILFTKIFDTKYFYKHIERKVLAIKTNACCTGYRTGSKIQGAVQSLSLYCNGVYETVCH